MNGIRHPGRERAISDILRKARRAAILFLAVACVSACLTPALAQDGAAGQNKETPAEPAVAESAPPQGTPAPVPTATDNPGRFAPDFCDFEITFPEKPQMVRKCMGDNECFEVNSYTMVYDLKTTVDVTANCTPSTPANYHRYTEAVMKAALAGMVEDRNLKDYDIKFSEEKDGTKNASLTGVGINGTQNKIYSGQLWIGPNSVFTLQAELVGSEHPQGDKTFSEILSSLKTKPGKQLPPKPKAANVPKLNGNN